MGKGLEDYENLPELEKLIESSNFKSIAIQSKNVNESVQLCDYLQELYRGTDLKFYILGDVLTGSCCVDVIAAKRLNTDCIVYIGEGCYYEVETGSCIFYLNKRIHFDLNKLSSTVESFCGEIGSDDAVLLVYDAPFNALVTHFARLLLGHLTQLYIAHIPICSFFTTNSSTNSNSSSTNSSSSSNSSTNSSTNNTNTNNSTNTNTNSTNSSKDIGILKYCNRTIQHYTRTSITNTSTNSSNSSTTTTTTNTNSTNTTTTNTTSTTIKYNKILYINVNGWLLNWLSVTDLDKKVFQMSLEPPGVKIVPRDLLARRFALVQAARGSRSFGLVGPAGAPRGANELRGAIRALLALRGISCYSFCLDELTEAKLLNFPGVGKFVFVGCCAALLSLPRELERLLIGPSELLVALDVLEWPGYSLDFGQLVQIIQSYISANSRL